MSSFHDQLYSEIDAARKLVAGFASRHGRKPAGTPQVPGEPNRQAQEESASAEIAALAAEEELFTIQARERAENRAKARAEKNAGAGGAQNASAVPGPAGSRWKAAAILKGLAKLRIKERSAAEDLIRQAHEVGNDDLLHAADYRPEQAAAPVRGMWVPSLGAAQVWYFTSQGTRCGPVSFTELRKMASSRVLDPRIDMVWKEGMEGWKQAGLLDGLFERRSIPADSPARRGGRKLRTFAALPTDLTAALASKYLSWPGAGRGLLWFGLLLFPPLWSQLLGWGGPALVAALGSSAVAKLLPIAAFVPAAVLIYLVLMRLVNLGMSRWWAVMLAIPVVNLWVGFRCLICPSGYGYHRKMDRTGIVIVLAIVIMAPGVWFLHRKHPNLLSPARLRTTLHRLIERERSATPDR